RQAGARGIPVPGAVHRRRAPAGSLGRPRHLPAHPGEFAQARLAFAMASYLRPGWAVAHFPAGELELHAGEIEEAAARLALFEETRGEDTPPAMVAEAQRMALALALHRERQAGPPTP